jgi:hypothetical protein
MLNMQFLVIETVWIAQFSNAKKFSDRSTVSLAIAVKHWEPALAFSGAINLTMTGMIAGSLIYHRKLQKRRQDSDQRLMPYSMVLTIWIESATLSTFAKLLQLALPALHLIPIVVPLCVCSGPNRH